MAIGFVIMGCAALAALVITTKLQGAVVFLVAGIGNAGIVVLTIPLLADLVPRRHMGAASGLLAAAGSIAAPLASILAGALSDLYGPRAIFAMMAAMIALAFALLPAVKSPAVADEPPVEPAVTPEPAQAPAAPAVPPAPVATSSPVSGTQRAAAQDELAVAPAESAAEPRPG
jgi:MFS family permease